jgi:uncharacterized ion transporter superfamily protein YfcC
MLRITMANKSKTMPLILMAAGSLLILGAIAFLVAPSIFAGQAPATAVPVVDSLADVPRVSLEDALAAYQAGSAIFVDVRDTQAFDSRHISGSISIPIEELPDRLAELDSQAWIIPY